MRPTILLTFVLICLNLFAGKKDEDVLNCSLIHKDFLYAAKTELTNIQYREFIHYYSSRGVNTDHLIPDTTVWDIDKLYLEPFKSFYFNHPAYNDYPVVGLTQKQMIAYCDWLGMILTQNFRGDDKSKFDSVVVRLPSKWEWQKAARGGLSMYNEYPWDGHSVRRDDKKYQGQFRLNCVHGRGDYMGAANLGDNAMVTAPGMSYWPNEYELYNCSGNVAEAISEEGIAMGGSWRQYPANAKVTSELRFTEPSVEIGFRYFVEVIRFKDEENKFEIDKKYLKSLLELVPLDSVDYAMNKEVSNALYSEFLKETNHVRPDSMSWESVCPYPLNVINSYQNHSRFSNYPVVNIGREDVKAFSDWFEKKYESVMGVSIEARLPSEKEWELLARGGLELSPYPWGGPYLRNAKGCLLANYLFVPETFMSGGDEGHRVPERYGMMYGADFDGALITCEVDSYHPNGWGMYNMSGNVYELVEGKYSDKSESNDLIKGGSWRSEPYFLQISSRQRETVNEISKSEIGFRLVVNTLQK